MVYIREKRKCKKDNYISIKMNKFKIAGRREAWYKRGSEVSKSQATHGPVV